MTFWLYFSTPRNEKEKEKAEDWKKHTLNGYQNSQQPKEENLCHVVSVLNKRELNVADVFVVIHFYDSFSSFS